MVEGGGAGGSAAHREVPGRVPEQARPRRLRRRRLGPGPGPGPGPGSFPGANKPGVSRVHGGAPRARAHAARPPPARAWHPSPPRPPDVEPGSSRRLPPRPRRAVAGVLAALSGAGGGRAAGGAAMAAGAQLSGAQLKAGGGSARGRGQYLRPHWEGGAGPEVASTSGRLVVLQGPAPGAGWWAEVGGT